jgi:predicted RND superfamily exporter protein
LYSYKDILYRYYKIERSYLDGYYLNVEDSSYIKDEESAKTYYLYEYVDPVNDNTNQSEESNNNEQVVNDSSDSEEENSVIENQSSDTSNQLIESPLSQLEEEPKLDDAKNDSAYLKEQNIPIDNNTNNIVLDNENIALELDKTVIPKKEINDKVTIKKENTVYQLFINFVNNISSKMYIICTILIFLTIIVIFKLRHHILSHQK